MSQRQQSVEHLETRQHLDGSIITTWAPRPPSTSVATVTALTTHGPVPMPDADVSQSEPNSIEFPLLVGLLSPAVEQVHASAPEVQEPLNTPSSDADAPIEIAAVPHQPLAAHPPGAKARSTAGVTPVVEPLPVTPRKQDDGSASVAAFQTHPSAGSPITSASAGTASTPPTPMPAHTAGPSADRFLPASGSNDREPVSDVSRRTIELPDETVEIAVAAPATASTWRAMFQRFIGQSSEPSMHDSPLAKSVAMRPEQCGESFQAGIRAQVAAITLAPPRWFKALALVILPAPVLLMCYLHQNSPVGRLLVGLAALLVTVAATWWWQRELLTRRRNLLAGMLMVTGVTITGAVLWNHSYLDYSKTVARKEVFRRTLNQHYTPFYGSPTSPSVLSATLVAITAAAGAALVLRAKLDIAMTRRRMAIILLLQATAIVTFAGSEGGRRFFGHSPQFEPFRKDAAHFNGSADLLGNYVATMPKLSWFGQHYPPGSAMLFMIERQFGVAPWGGSIIGLAVLLATVFVYFAARELSDRATVHNLATMSFAAATGPLVYSSISTTPMVLLPGTIALWALLRAIRTGSGLSAIALGVAMVGFTMISFSAIFFAVVLGLFLLPLLLMRMGNGRAIFKTALISGTTALGVVLLMRLVLGFDLIACASAGVKVHHQQAATSGFDSFSSYFMRSSGNFLAFGLANLPLVAVITTGAILLRRAAIRTPSDLILPATLLAIVLASCSGKFYLETERIWILFVPPLVLAAAVEMARHDDYRGRWDARVIIVAMIVFAAVQEAGFKHYWD